MLKKSHLLKSRSAALGASLHDTLTRLKTQPSTYSSIELRYSPTSPVTAPVILNLPRNGLRLLFDGPDQRLRLIEVLDFCKIRLSYKNQDIVKQHEHTTSDFPAESRLAGPVFRHIYHKLFGLTYAGEYIPPKSGNTETGVYILSYPGVAFAFPLLASAWSPNVDHVSLLSSSATSPATSMAVFEGDSWPDARRALLTAQPSSPRSSLLAGRGKEVGADEVEVTKIHGEGRVELLRRNSQPFWIFLSETTPQELITELGPPDAIYRKHDRRLSIHGTHPKSEMVGFAPEVSSPTQDESTDTDQSSGCTESDESGDDDRQYFDASDDLGAGYFYNYFRHGFDILISKPARTSHTSIGEPGHGASAQPTDNSVPPHNHMTATKILFHGNVPGSYPFNRHRRSQWTLEHTSTTREHQPLNSEMHFDDVFDRLRDAFRGTYASDEEERAEQRNLVLNRGWSDSPGSSCEFLGGWEETMVKDKASPDLLSAGPDALGNTDIFGFPGMVFEVLKSGAICSLTIF